MKNLNLLLIGTLTLAPLALAGPQERGRVSGQDIEGGAATTEVTPRQDLAERLVKLTTLKGLAVKAEAAVGERAERVADLADIILDPQTGRAKYAILSNGTSAAVPLNVLSAAWNAEDGAEPMLEVTTTLTLEQLASAPVFNERAWKTGDNSWEQEVASYYRAVAAGEPIDAGAEREEVGTTEASAEVQSMLRVSEVIGNDVVNAAGETLASVGDIVIEPQTMGISYLILSSGREQRAVAMGSVMPTRDAEGAIQITTELTQESLAAAPAISAADWETQGTKTFAERITSGGGAAREGGRR